MKDPQRRAIRFGEPLAIQPDHVHASPEAIWWDMWNPQPENERVGKNADIAVVHIRGALDHHRGYGGCSYESILDRIAGALSGEDVVEREKRAHYWDDEPYECAPATPPKCLVLCIDSPGGVVSGLNQTVFAIRRMAARAGITVYAYVGELATSAAFALACSCDEIIIPPSGIAGSIGVISMMVDATAADAKMGLKIAVLTSGARKADGHPHAPMTDAATNAEQRRVDQLAKQFYALVADVRPLNVKQIEALQAGIFVGKAAVKAGLADAVMGWDKLVKTLDAEAPGTPKPRKPLDTSGTRGSTSTQPAAIGPNRHTEHAMSLLGLQAVVTDLKNRIAKTSDPTRKAALQPALVAAEAAVAEYKKVKHTKETHEEETADEEEDEEESGNETDREEGGGDDAPGDGDDDEDDEEDDEEEAKKAASEEEEEAKKAASSIVTASGVKGDLAKTARLAIRKAVRDAVARTLARRSGSSALVAAVRKLTGKKSTAKMIATLEARTAGTEDMRKRLETIEKDTRKRNRSAMIDEALAKRHITRHTAATLRKKSATYVKEYLGMHNTPLVNIDEEAARVPDGTPDQDVPQGMRKMVEQSIVAQGLTGEKADAFRTQAFTDYRERQAKTNGGVY